MNSAAQHFLNDYLSSLSLEQRQSYQSFSADYFCADEYNANLCAQLILQGKKTATCSLAHWYQSGQEPMPVAGHLQVVTQWDGQPVCIIEITAVSQCLYNEVSAEFAYAEGEGDRSLNHWRKTHWAFFSAECKDQGLTPQETMPLVSEHFKVVFPTS